MEVLASMEELIKNISKIMKRWKEESSSKEVLQYRFFEDSRELYIYTFNIGLYIGLHGELYDKYTEILKKEIPEINGIDFIEINDSL